MVYEWQHNPCIWCHGTHNDIICSIYDVIVCANDIICSIYDVTHTVCMTTQALYLTWKPILPGLQDITSSLHDIKPPFLCHHTHYIWHCIHCHRMYDIIWTSSTLYDIRALYDITSTVFFWFVCWWKGMASHYSILALRILWAVWKAKRYDTERWTPQVGRCPICYWRRAEKRLQKEWRVWVKAETTPSCECA